MGHGGPLQLSADVASLGLSTLRRWLNQFVLPVVSCVHPLCMTGEERVAVSANFACVATFKMFSLLVMIHTYPSGQKMYKRVWTTGITSILAVAFGDLYYRFFDLDVGVPGCAGDNTVLQKKSLMRAIEEDPGKWLGSHCVMLGDCGASDGSKHFVNPYHSPTRPEHAWFNFCHSSTRFFIEELFGRWKNRWRFFLHPHDTDHKLTTRLIYISAILHNFCTYHARDEIPTLADDTTPDWLAFYEHYGAQRCFACRDRGMQCVHQAILRNGNASTRAARMATSELREHLCTALWGDLLSGRSVGMGTITNDDLQLATAENIDLQGLQETMRQLEDRTAGRWRSRR